jgi:hypothetical protein
VEAAALNEWAMWAWYVEQLTLEVALAWADGDEESELDWGLVERPHEFIPLGFEAGGAFGPATREGTAEGFSTGGGEGRGRAGVRAPRTSTTGVRWCGGSTGSSA